MLQAVKVRFAPSPTGLLHLGNYRTALFNYLFAKKSGGKFVLRIEDTDKARSKKEYEDNILESLAWLGLKHDEFYRQSERTGIYRKYLEKLIAEDRAYHASDNVIRFRNPNRPVTFSDLIRGEISFDTTELGDFVIAKNLDEPIFHLTVVVDDFEMGITRVIRGEDHISNTPRHILIQEAINAPRPTYAHIPLILSPDRSKLSKRHGAIALTEYRDRGYLPEALINFLALLGWNPGTEQELFSLDELISVFDLSKAQKSGAIFNQEKLDWYNREYLKKLPDEEFAKLSGTAIQLAPELKNRATTLVEARALAAEFDYLDQAPTPDKELLKTREFLPAIIELLEKIPEDNFRAEIIKNAIWDFATEKGRGKVLWPMRAALTGKKQSPDPFFVAGILGRAETIKRLKYAASL